MSRRRPDGFALSWTLSYRLVPGREGLVPFLIDWNSAPHPSEALGHELDLVELTGHHPDPDAVRADLAALGADLVVRKADVAALVATIASPRGKMNLV
jgi:hypothetical protein